MASRSRAHTRPGADPEGRFRPAPSPDLVARAAELQQALAPARPSETVRSAAWYGTRREQERFPQALVWSGLTAVFVAFLLLLRVM